MTDLAVLAIGLGVLPLSAILLYSLRRFVLTRREVVWGFLAGVLAFLALGHAMAAVLVNKSLFGDPAIAIAVAFVGLAVGAGIAWSLLEGPFIRTEPDRLIGGTAAVSCRVRRGSAAAAGPGGRPWDSSPSPSSTSSSSEAHVAADSDQGFAGQRETSATMRADASVAVPRARWIVTTAQSFPDVI